MLAYSTLRPGLLVSCSTSIKGNVNYETVDLENEHRIESGAARAKWETTRVIEDPVEFEAAKKARGQVLTAIRRVCATSAFGLLCPEANADRLEEAIAEGRRIVDEFNATARLTRLRLYVMTGKVAQDDVEAVRAINSEVRELMDAMTTGIKRMDVKAIRDAADRTREIGNMLTPEAQDRVAMAIKVARDVANAVAKEVRATGNAAAIEIDSRAVRAITTQRTAFLDVSDEVEVARPTVTGRTIEFQE